MEAAAKKSEAKADQETTSQNDGERDHSGGFNRLNFSRSESRAEKSNRKRGPGCLKGQFDVSNFKNRTVGGKGAGLSLS